MNIYRAGFTLIEMIIFIIVLGIISAALGVTIALTLRYSTAAHNQSVATTTAVACMEYLIGQAYTSPYGYHFNNQNQTCPGGSGYSNNTICNVFNITPSGFTTTVNITCTTVNGINGTQAFKLMTVTVNGLGSVVMKEIIADY